MAQNVSGQNFISAAIEVEDALSLLLESLQPQIRTVKVPVMQACGMVAAEDVKAMMMVPPFSKSAMDGYAVCAADIAGASKDSPVQLTVKDELFAGDYKEIAYEPGTAVRVMTGAYVPDGYDAVVRQEDTDYGEQQVKVYIAVKPYMNYCRIGEDIKSGQVLFHKNTRIEPVHIGLLASVGVTEVMVYEPMRVAILSTGTELRDVGQPLAPGQIYNNISYMLAATMQRCGVKISMMETCVDEENLMFCKLKQALENADFVITTGGVSVGKKDIVPAVLGRMGAQILFRRANIQPGTPTTASECDGKLILSLSGNPYAALANFELYFWALLAKFMHNKYFEANVATAVLRSEYGKVNRMRRLIRAREEGGEVFLPTQVHAASVINNLTECNCFIDLEAGRNVDIGDIVTIRYIT